jgi:hypothetical protein
MDREVCPLPKRTDKVFLYILFGLVVLGGLCVACLVGVVVLPVSWWSHGNAPETAKLYLKTNPKVISEIGAVQGFGWLPSGSVQEMNGKGKAHLIFTLKGEKGEARAVLDLTKAPGKDWQVDAATLYVAGREIPLKGQPPPGDLSPPQPGQTAEGSDADGVAA